MRNVVFLTTDTHANLVNEIRLRTLGALEGTGMWEVVTGPVATNTFAKEDDGVLGAPAAGQRDRAALFLKPPPPRGLGHALRRPRHVQLRAGEGHVTDADSRAPRRARAPGAGGDGSRVRAARPAGALKTLASLPTTLSRGARSSVDRAADF